MAIYKELITKQVIDTTNIATITFNVPSGYKHLEILYSARENTVTGTSFVANVLRFNGDSSSGLYSNRRLYASGSSVSSASNTSQNHIFIGSTASSVPTANTFTNTSINILNYNATNTFKPVSIDSTIENNAQFAEQHFVAGLWRNTAAITSVSVISQITFTQHSTFYLYGIK